MNQQIDYEDGLHNHDSVCSIYKEVDNYDNNDDTHNIIQDTEYYDNAGSNKNRNKMESRTHGITLV